MYNRSLSSSYSASVRNSVLCSFVLLLTSVAALADEFCPVHYWWDHERDDCIRCTVCDVHSIVLRPCQPHQDVVCGTLSDLEYDLNLLAAIDEPKQQRGFASNHHHNLRVVEKSDIEMILDDWQTLVLALASCACLLFFIVAACLFWQHTRYWKKMERIEREYNADAEELSSRLMHTIIDIRNDENGRVVLAEARKDKIENPLNLRCIYFEELLNSGNNDGQPIVTKPLIKNSVRKNSAAIQQQQQKPEIDKKKTERGNCYTEPTQQRDNAVTSELYLIT